MTPKTYFEELSYALRRKELLPRATEEDGLLPVEWNGRPLCRSIWPCLSRHRY